MPAAPLAVALATALSAGVLVLDLATLSISALVGLLWVALAPLMAGLSETPGRCALTLLAVAAPQLALGVAADHSAGAALEQLLPSALAGWGWTAALGATATASVHARRSERWFVIWMVFACAGPLFELALSAGGEGSEHWLAGTLTRASPLSSLLGLAPLSAYGAHSPATWGPCLAPWATIALAASVAKVPLWNAAEAASTPDDALGAKVGDRG